MNTTVVGWIALLSGCGRAARVDEPTSPPQPIAPAHAAPADAPRDVASAWIAAVGARDARAIEAMLALPFTLYYDDAWTGRRPADCDPVRVVRSITTEAERRKVAACIAATVQVSAVAPYDQPVGIWEPSTLIPYLPEDVHGTLQTVTSEHVFVHVPMIGAGDFDSTLVVPGTGAPTARVLVLWTIHG